MKPIRGLYLLLGVALSLSCASALAEISYRLTTVDNPANADYYLYATGLNNKGEVVGFTEGAVPGTRAFLWKEGVFTDLGAAAGSNSTSIEAVGINDRSVIVGNRNDGSPRNFRIRNNQLTAVNVSPNTAVGAIYGNNNKNQIFGWAQNLPFIWTRGVTTYLPALPGSDEYSTQAWGLNDHGVAAGTSGTLDVRYAVVWKDGAVNALPLPSGATRAEGRDINNREQVIGTSFHGGNQYATIWTDGVPTELPAASPSAYATFASALNDWGAVVGTTFLPAGGGIPTLWIGGQALDLNAMIAADDPLRAFVTLSQAYYINDRGQIVATGVHSGENKGHVYLLTPSYRPAPVNEE